MKVFFLFFFFIHVNVDSALAYKAEFLNSTNEIEIQKVLKKHTKISKTNEGCNYLFKNKDLLKNSKPSLSAYIFALRLSNCFYEFYDGVESINYLYEAKKIASQLNDSNLRITRTAKVYYRLAFKYYDKLEYNTAEKYIDSTLRILAPSKIKNFDYANVIAMKGRIFGEKDHKLDSALFYLQKAGDIYKKLDQKRYINKNIRTQGRMFLVNGEPTIALTYFKTALEGFIALNDIPYIKGTWLRVLDLLLNNSSVGKSFMVANKTYRLDELPEKLKAIIGKDSTIDHNIYLYNLMKTYYTQNNNKDSLLVYQNKIIELQEQIQNTNSKAKLRAVTLNENKIKITKETNFLVTLINKYKLIVFYCIASLLVLLFFGWYYFGYLKDKKKVAEALLKANIKNLENSKAILDLELKNKQQDYLIQYLELNKKEVTLGNIEEQLKKNTPVNVIKNTLTVNKTIKSFKKELNAIYETVDKNFVDQLKKKHPNLTKQDINYCILIVLDYSTQDIVNFLKSTPKTVNQHKYRLKKKLNLTTKENILFYLKNNLS